MLSLSCLQDIQVAYTVVLSLKSTPFPIPIARAYITTHLAQANSLSQAALSPGFYFPFQTTLCCWINLPKAQSQSYLMLSYLPVTQYTLPHNRITCYHRPWVTWHMQPHNHITYYCHIVHVI